MMPKPMTPAEREAFLADAHVGVLSVSYGDERGPLSTPLWYTYAPGDSVQFMTMPHSRKAQLFQRGRRATLCVQSEAAPYRYVTVEGPVTRVGPVTDEWRRAVHHRYLGPELGESTYQAIKDVLSDEVVFQLTPKRWTSSDYSAEFGQA